MITSQPTFVDRLSGSVLCLWLLLPCAVVATAADEAAADRFAAELATLAAKCDELGLAEQAAITREWIVPRQTGRIYLFLPGNAAQPAPQRDVSERVQQWNGKFRSLRNDQAERLIVQAGQAAKKENGGEAYRLFHEVLRENPEHAEARRILGQGKVAALGAPAVGRTEHPVIGWPKGKYWRLESPHFEIATNHSPKAARELAERLEELHAAWRQVFFEYWADPDALSARMAGGKQRLERVAPPKTKHQVLVFKTRDEYLAALGRDEPKIALTTGIYLHRKRLACFYYDMNPKTLATWRHEATHQLFQETFETVAEPGNEANAWIIEGIAMYMESLQEQAGCFALGGWDAERLQFARYRALAGDYSAPLSELVTWSREALQTNPEIRKIYSQSAGMSHFLMNSAQGRYRRPLNAYLMAIYRGQDDAGTLPKLVQSLEPPTSLAALDAEYRKFLTVTDEQLAGILAPERLRSLSLGRTPITDRGLTHLADCKNLEWLDLTATAVTDEGFAHLASLAKLTQLFLDGVKITDASLPHIGRFRELEELDLSNTRITDAGLPALANLKKLKVLYLSGTAITDAGLATLTGLKTLEVLDLERTNVTSAAQNHLHKTLPRLKSD